MRTVDLFSGCGGMTMGFLRQGFRIVEAFESWDVAIECHQANFNHPVVQMNLSDVKAAVAKIKPLRPDVIIGGPPCQDFSRAGKHVEGARADLTRCFAEIVSIVHPMCFVMENVDQAKKSKAYSSAREILKDAGYGLTEVVLDASRCGVPQKRSRFFCFGMQGKEDGFAEDAFYDRLSDRPMTVKEYFGDSLKIDNYFRMPRNYGTRGIFSVNEPSPTIRTGNSKLPSTYKNHPHPKDAAPVTEDLRSLTYQERAKIQTFPDDFKWIGKRAEIEKMIGNAVPVNLAQYVAGIVRMFMTADS